MTESMIKNLEWLRKNIIGRNKLFPTPFGNRPLVYADYTASGRGLTFIENYLRHLLDFYANSHTDDDFTGKTMTTLLHQAESKIKNLVGAGSTGRIIFVGTGATGAITRLASIIGIYLPPATKMRIEDLLKNCSEGQERETSCQLDLMKAYRDSRPVVFVGPYEHHSNEIMWRQSLCDVIEIPLDKKGELDLQILEKEVSNPKYANRAKIGSFSAASNVSGIKTPVYEVARILHSHGAFACFDYAASGPYVEIDMNHDDQSYFDAIYVSPHKFLGGPGSSGLLVINERIYLKQLPPSIAAGGTVKYVTMEKERYEDDIEAREQPGTPGILQGIKACMAFELKEKIGIPTIHAIEKYFFDKFYQRFKNNTKMMIYGTTDAEKKVNIIAFNVVHKERIYHPKFFTKLLNDLFGIQTRAGCSCAGPYGHRLLNIDKEHSDRFICLIDNKEYSGMKPGWVRLNLHYSFDFSEFNYICDALEWLMNEADKFLPLYQFDFKTGEWNHTHQKNNFLPSLEIDDIIQGPSTIMQDCPSPDKMYGQCLEEARNLAAKLKAPTTWPVFDSELERVMFFHVHNYINYKGGPN